MSNEVDDAAKMEAGVLPQAQIPFRVRQVPDWETPVKRPERAFIKSVLSSSSDFFKTHILPVFRTKKSSSLESPIQLKPPNASRTIWSFSDPSSPSGLPDPSQGKKAVRLKAALITVFDKVIPPNGDYFGRSRYFFFTFIMAPLLTLLALSLGLGLGFGLRARKIAPHQTGMPYPENGPTVWAGELTYYNPGLGACGLVQGDNDAVAALSKKVFDPKTPGGNPNNNPLCNRQIKVMRGGVERVVTVVDRCEACDLYDVDLPPGIFDQLAPHVAGRVDGRWQWI